MARHNHYRVAERAAIPLLRIAVEHRAPNPGFDVMPAELITGSSRRRESSNRRNFGRTGASLVTESEEETCACAAGELDYASRPRGRSSQVGRHGSAKAECVGSIPTSASNPNCACSNGLRGRRVQTDTKTDTNFPIRELT